MNGTQEELEEFTRQLKQQAEEMRKAFDAIRQARYIRPTVEELLEQGGNWQKWFAWRPVKDIHGTRHWLETIYRIRSNNYINHDDWNWYYYGTVFDVLKQ